MLKFYLDTTGMYLVLYTLGRVMAWALVLMALWSCARAR